MKPDPIKLFLIILFLPLLSMGQQRWETVISDSLSFFFITNTLAYDGGQIVLSEKENNYHNVIFKISNNGDILWQKQIYLDILNAPYGIRQNQLGEAIVYGITELGAHLTLFNACGDLLWCNTYSDTAEFQEIFHADGVFLDNGNIVTLFNTYNRDSYKHDIGLMSFDMDGNLLWVHAFNLLDKYPSLTEIYGWHLQLFNDFAVISAFGYYLFPGNPNLAYLKPFFIKTDNLFNEEWMLPYGIADTILGDARGVASFENGIFHGYGLYVPMGQSSANSLLMNFDLSGQETGYYGIANEAIDSVTNDNFFIDLKKRDDTSYFTVMKYGSQGPWYNPVGEVIVDTTGNVFQHQAHDNITGGYYPLEKDTVDNKYYLAYQLSSNNQNNDILLYKFNADLAQAPFDTTHHVYDSLCDHPIVSDTIYLNGCDVITGIEDAPTPEQYYHSLKTIPLHVSPNPAMGSVRFEMENTVYHKNIMVQVFDINGNRVFELSLADGQTAISTSAANWPDGLYVVVASSSTGGAGSAKFVVKE